MHVTTQFLKGSHEPYNRCFSVHPVRGDPGKTACRQASPRFFQRTDDATPKELINTLSESKK
jgi:hypothetical protein